MTNAPYCRSVPPGLPTVIRETGGSPGDRGPARESLAQPGRRRPGPGRGRTGCPDRGGGRAHVDSQRRAQALCLPSCTDARAPPPLTKALVSQRCVSPRAPATPQPGAGRPTSPAVRPPQPQAGADAAPPAGRVAWRGSHGPNRLCALVASRRQPGSAARRANSQAGISNPASKPDLQAARRSDLTVERGLCRKRCVRA